MHSNVNRIRYTVVDAYITHDAKSKCLRMYELNTPQTMSNNSISFSGIVLFRINAVRLAIADGYHDIIQQFNIKHNSHASETKRTEINNKHVFKCNRFDIFSRFFICNFMIE